MVAADKDRKGWRPRDGEGWGRDGSGCRYGSTST